MFDRETAQLEYPGAQSETAVLAKADFETQETTAVENGPQIVSVKPSPSSRYKPRERGGNLFV